jgi:Fe(3+) dicitrate transport protein
MKISNTKLDTAFNDTIKGFSVFFSYCFLCSIAQNKIAGVITDGDGQKLTTVEVYNKTTNIKVFTDAAGAFEFDLIRKLDFVFFKRATHCRTKQHYNWQHLTIALKKIINLSEVIGNKMLKYLRSIN